MSCTRHASSAPIVSNTVGAVRVLYCTLTYVEEDGCDAVPSSMVTECILVHSGKVIVRLILPSYPIVYHLHSVMT